MIYRVAIFDINSRDNILQLVTKEPVNEEEAERIKNALEPTLDRSREYADIISSEF